MQACRNDGPVFYLGRQIQCPIKPMAGMYPNPARAGGKSALP